MRNVPRYIAGLFLLWAGALPALSQGRIQMTADPVFSGMAGIGITPVVVTLQNVGPSVDGAVTVDASGTGMGGNRTYVYPVSLPTGSVKKVITYPRVDSYVDALHVSFNGSFLGKKPAMDVPVNASGAFSVALLGDQAGGLGALRSLKPQVNVNDPMQNAASFRDAYAQPENAPDRAAGYATLTALVLTNGVERLNPQQWEAIRRWAMAGGTVICAGGAGAVYLQTPGAAALLPVRNVQGASVSSLSLPGVHGLPAGPYALMTGAPAAGASVLARSDGRVTLATRRLGAGTVVFLAFSPFEAPLRGWSGSAGFWQAVLHEGRPAFSWEALRAGSTNLEPTGPISSRGAYNNPFQIQLPPIGTVAGIFVLYFVLAVPVTYFVLKKAKRLEWAWVTNPVLAGVFAFVFYLFTAQLYQSGMSRRTGGVLVAASDGKDALFLGYTQMFYPRGGNHPLTVPDAESLEVSDMDTDYYGRPRGQQDALTTVDTGAVSAPDFSVSNLAFRNIYYVQPVSLTGTVTARLARNADGSVSGTVRNGTGQDLDNVTILMPAAGRYAWMPRLKAGGTAQVKATKPMWATHTARIPARAPRGPKPEYRTEVQRSLGPELQVLASRFYRAGLWKSKEPFATAGGALLFGQASGEPYGPNMGRFVAGSKVDVVVSLPVEGGA